MRSLTILRISLGVTFLWIGILIFQHPGAWANYLQSWFISLLPVSPTAFMSSVSYLDILLGALLIINIFTPYVAGISAIHLVGVLISSGITDVTVRDIGLLGGCIYLFLETWSKRG